MMMGDTVDAKPAGKDDQTDARPQFGHAGVTRLTDEEFRADNYKMDYPKRGMAVIFNNKTFQPSTGMEVRTGTDVDANGICDLLTTLGFEEPEMCHDFTVSAMRKKLKEVAKADHRNKSCFVCVILSHGEEGYVYGADDKISVDELIDFFKGDKCPSLAAKPKLFFIQACLDTAEEAPEDSHGGIPQASSLDIVDRRIPTEADFLLAYSVIPGSFSWQHHPGQGSWFIQAVVDVFMKNWQSLDVMTMMTRVSKKVAQEFEENLPKTFLKYEKRIPCITCMLTRDLCFS